MEVFSNQSHKGTCHAVYRVHFHFCNLARFHRRPCSCSPRRLRLRSRPAPSSRDPLPLLAALLAPPPPSPPPLSPPPSPAFPARAVVKGPATPPRRHPRPRPCRLACQSSLTPCHR